MPSHAYFAELTAAVLMDADEVKGFLQKQSPEGRQAFAERMHERIIETFTKLLEVELEQGDKLQDWQEKVEKVRRAAQEAGGGATLAQAREEVGTFIQKAGLRIREAFVGTLTK